MKSCLVLLNNNNIIYKTLCSIYRVAHNLLGLTDQSNMFYYNYIQNHRNVNTLINTHICPIYLYDWTLNDLSSYHNKTYLNDQSIQAGGEPPCRQVQSIRDFAGQCTLGLWHRYIGSIDLCTNGIQDSIGLRVRYLHKGLAERP